MKITNRLKVVLFGVVSVFCSNQSVASKIEIDIDATIYASMIMIGDGSGYAKSPSLWALGNGLPLGSTLNLGLSYDTDTPSKVWHSPYDNSDRGVYKGASISIASNDFQVNLPGSTISINSANGYPSNLINSFNALFSAPENTGVSFTFANEVYYLMEANIAMLDESGAALNDASLLTSQSQFDAFWLNNIEPGKYSNHLATFSMYIAKDPSVNSYPNGTWPNGDALYVVGYFNDLKLAYSQVPEPTGLILLLIGSAGIFVRRFRRM